jgi:hypothetical protein
MSVFRKGKAVVDGSPKSSSPAARSGSRSKAVDLVLQVRAECRSAVEPPSKPADGDDESAFSIAEAIQNELAVESFFPADDETARILRDIAR